MQQTKKGYRVHLGGQLQPNAVDAYVQKSYTAFLTELQRFHEDVVRA